MNDEAFWSIIESFNWSSDHDYERIAAQIKNELSDDEASQIESICEKKIRKLSKFIWYVQGVADDGFSDLCWHILGSGKESYDKAMVPGGRDYAQKLINEGAYEESFAYIFFS